MNVFIVFSCRDIEDFCDRVVLGVRSSYDKCYDLIKEQIQNIFLSYKNDRFVIEEWAVDGTAVSVRVLSKEANIRLAKELGVLQEE